MECFREPIHIAKISPFHVVHKCGSNHGLIIGEILAVTWKRNEYEGNNEISKSCHKFLKAIKDTLKTYAAEITILEVYSHPILDFNGLGSVLTGSNTFYFFEGRIERA